MSYVKLVLGAVTVGVLAFGMSAQALEPIGTQGLRTIPVADRDSIVEIETGGGGVQRDWECGCATPIYINDDTDGPYMYLRVPDSGDGTLWLADDLLLDFPNGYDEWDICGYQYMTYAYGGTAPYHIDSALYRFDACTSTPEPLVDWYTSDCCTTPVPIPDTQASADVLMDGMVLVKNPLPNRPVTVEQYIFMHLDYSGANVADNAGWIIAYEAEKGFTDDVWVEDIFGVGCGFFWFGGDPYAGFMAEVWGDSRATIEMEPVNASGGHTIVPWEDSGCTCKGNYIYLDCYDLPMDVQIEVLGSNWDPHDLGLLVQGYASRLSCDLYFTNPYYSGLTGELVASNNDCSPGPCAVNQMGSDTGRADYIFPGAEAQACNIVDMCPLPGNMNGRYSCVSGAFAGVADDHTSKYISQYSFNVAAGSKGCWELSLDPETVYTTLKDPNETSLVPLCRIPANICIETGFCCFDIGPGTTNCTDDLTECECMEDPPLGLGLPSPKFWEAGEVCPYPPEDCCQCTTDEHCADGDACTVDTCDPICICNHTPVTVGADECCDPTPVDIPTDVGGLGAVASTLDPYWGGPDDPCTENLCNPGGGCAVAPQCGVPYNPCDQGGRCCELDPDNPSKAVACTYDDSCNWYCMDAAGDPVQPLVACDPATDIPCDTGAGEYCDDCECHGIDVNTMPCVTDDDCVFDGVGGNPDMGVGSPCAAQSFPCKDGFCYCAETGKCCYDIGPGTTQCTDGVTENQCDALPGPSYFTPGAECTGDIQVDCPEGKPDENDEYAIACPECIECAESDLSELMHPVYLVSGEFYESVVDLRIPGRGLDFTWARKYRSKIGPDTAMGHGWDFSYNVRIESSGQSLIVHNGAARRHAYFLQPDGTWTRPDFFRVIEQTSDDSYTLTFPDTGKWNFHPLDGSPHQGKIASIVDRNGNTISLDYDGLGRLVTVHDTLDTPAHNRDITIAYNADGFIESVTDFAGRSVRYEYYDGIEPGGNFGDLKSVTTPAVVHTPDFPIPPGHEFPDGKTTIYTYSAGFSEDRLNHNLLTITDPKGQTYLTNEYDPTTDPDGLHFDRIRRQTWGNPCEVIDVVYVPQVPTEENNFAVMKVIYNDRVGNVKEFFYDVRNRGVISREYTGRADPCQPTTETDNRPTGQLRPDHDPDYSEARYEYNADSLRTRVVHPNGNEELFTYDTGNAGRRSQGNLLEHCRLPGPLGSDQPQICESFEYDDDTGGCCGTNAVTKEVDGLGHETLHDYDDNGNRIHTEPPIEDWEYNEFGQMTAHVLPDNGSSHRRRDQYAYYDDGPQMGYLHQQTVDVPNFALTTAYEYNAIGDVTRITDPRGHDTQYVVNQLGQTVREISREVTDGSGLRYERDTFYGLNDNVVRVDIQNVDDQGNLVPDNPYLTTTYEYEILNYRTRTIEEVDPDHHIVTEYEYDGNRNRTLVRYGEATNGNQPANVIRTLYDERDLTFREIRAEGDPHQSTTQYDYDGNRNLVKTHQGLEDTPRVTENAHDGYDRLVTTLDPMGNVTTYHYDANHNRTESRTDGELIDIPDSAGNIRLSETAYIYDEMDRLIRTETEFFDTETQAPIDDGKSITQTFYSKNSQVIRVEDDNGHETLTEYDTANRRSVITDHKNNTVTYTYDANSNVTAITEVEKSDLGNPDESFTTTYTYDNLDRLVQTADNMGNTHTYGYDSRDNRTVTTDALDHETRYEYDGLNRLIKTVRDMDDEGANPDAVPGDADPDIVTAQTWDDTSRLVGQTDDNGNTTTYVYDALNRMTAEQYADTTVHSYTYDVHGNRITMTDANGSVATSAYDSLDRLTDKTIDRAAVIDGDPVDILGTTFEVYKYDGLSRLVHAEDDDSLVTRSFDSLSRVTRETLNGQTTTSEYDGVGNQLTCTYPGGRAITNAYDELDRKKTISDQSGTIATYDYVGPGRVERREYANGTRTDYTYDGITGVPNPINDFGVKRIIHTKHSRIADGTIIDDRTYRWDPMYNKTQRKDIRGPGLTHDYTYDPVYRLVHTRVTEGLPPLTVRETDYTLDGVGNREEVVGTPDPGTYTMDPTLPEPADFQMNQYTATPFDGRRYDPNGNLIAFCQPAEQPLPEDELSQVCTNDDDCTPESTCISGVCYVPKNKYLSFSPGNAGEQVAFRVMLASSTLFPDLVGSFWWVQEHDPSDPPDVFRLGCTPQFQDWSTEPAVIHVGDIHITTEATYDVQAIRQYCPLDDPVGYSPPLSLPTVSTWGDCVGAYTATFWNPPDSVVGLDDIMAAIARYQGAANQPPLQRVDIDEDRPNTMITVGDLMAIILAFQGGGYPYPGPVPCPPLSGPPPDPEHPGSVIYDYRNQMVEFHDSAIGQRHMYAYDALGRRITRIVDAEGVSGNPGVTYYSYDGWQVIEERNAAGITQATYVYGLYIDEVLNMQRSSSLRPSVPSSLDYYYHTDDLYNVTAITNANGDVIERYEYADYGQPLDPSSLSPSVPSSLNSYLFTGRRYDPETGWYYYRTRYLDPAAGRFTTRDTIGIWGDSFNLGSGFTYVGNGLWSNVDPMGLAVPQCPGKDGTEWTPLNDRDDLTSSKSFRFLREFKTSGWYTSISGKYGQNLSYVFQSGTLSVNYWWKTIIDKSYACEVALKLVIKEELSQELTTTEEVEANLGASISGGGAELSAKIREKITQSVTVSFARGTEEPISKPKTKCVQWRFLRYQEMATISGTIHEKIFLRVERRHRNDSALVSVGVPTVHTSDVICWRRCRPGPESPAGQ